MANEESKIQERQQIAAEVLRVSQEIDRVRAKIEYLEFRYGPSTNPEEIQKIEIARKELNDLQKLQKELSDRL